jgi:hypothetical protein
MALVNPSNNALPSMALVRVRFMEQVIHRAEFRALPTAKTSGISCEGRVDDQCGERITGRSGGTVLTELRKRSFFASALLLPGATLASNLNFL